MDFLSDIITYIRRIIKTPSNASITDALLIDYVNRFWVNDVDARLQLFDLKTKYSFITQPGVDQYNMPLYSPQTVTNPADVAMYPVYQGFLDPVYINGVKVKLETQKNAFFNAYPNIVQNFEAVAVGTGSTTNFTFQIPIGLNPTVQINPPYNSILRGHVDMAGIIATGVNVDPPNGLTYNPLVPNTSTLPAVYITTTDTNLSNMIVMDSGQFLRGPVTPSATPFGLLISPGPAPFGNRALSGGYSTTLNTINYLTGQVNVTFPNVVGLGSNINVSCFFFESGLPRSILFYNNTLTLRVPPALQYLVELDAYLTPAAFFNSNAAIPFGYMAEYIARGAARKILTDTGDVEQFQFYEPLFREQELLVWKRSQRQWTNNRTYTIYSLGNEQGYGNGNNFGGGWQ
jgi:hypothetical protein